MTMDEAIKHAREVAAQNERGSSFWRKGSKNYESCIKCAKEHRQLAGWLEELRVFKKRIGDWLRITDEPEDDRYKCSRCGNIVHYKDEMDLYTFNNWCGRCGSYNGKSQLYSLIGESQERDDENCDDILESIYAERDGKKMNGSFELTLNNPLTKEDWNKIMDVELENTPSVTFKTPEGKQAKYIKADILEKIRKEIVKKEIALKCTEVSNIASKIAYIEVLKIIDKYKAESEE